MMGNNVVENKRPLGITLFALFHLIFALYISVSYLIWYFKEKPIIPPVFTLLIILIVYVISFGLFKRNRKIYYFLLGFAIYRVSSAFIFTFVWLFQVTFPWKEFLMNMFWVVFYSFALYYFTRPKIIEQFK